MSVQRIRDINIKSKGLFVGLYGVSGQEFYLDSDLRKYNFYQQLSIYLKEEGYDKVIMYDAVNNFHSYFKNDLEQLKYASKVSEPKTRTKSRVRGSMGRRKPESKKEIERVENSSITFFSVGDRRNGFYRDQMNTRIRDYFQNEIHNSKTKTAFIIKDFNSLNNDQQDAFVTLFREAQHNYIINKSQNKVLIIYDSIFSESLVEKFQQNRAKLIYNKFFEEIFIKSDKDSNDVNINTTYKIKKPKTDEIRNLIHYQRILKEVPVDFLELDAIITSINSQRKSLVKLYNDFMKVKSIDLKELKNKGIVENNIISIDQEKLNQSVQKIKGQEDNSRVITEQIILWNNLYKGQKPLNLFLVGASGVGKTYTTKVIGNLLKPNGFGYELIALSEFKSEHERSKLFGAPPGYEGGSATPRLLESIKKNNGKLVICFDEVEEAHPEIMSSLVNLLDEGTIAFNVKGKTIIEDFSKCIIFFTSNTAMEKLVEFKRQFISNGGSINSEEFKQRVFRHLNEEGLLHKKLQRRIEKFLVYGTLPPRAIIEIAYEEINKVIKMKKRKWTLSYCEPKYLSKIAINTSDQISGIDGVEGTIKTEVAPIVNKSDFPKESKIQLNYQRNTVTLKVIEDEHNYVENIEQALEIFTVETERL